MSAREGRVGGEPPEVVEPPQDRSGTPRERATRARFAWAASARASATRLNTFFLPAATIPSPETRPDLMDGARRGGGSDPARRFRPSASSPAAADGYGKNNVSKQVYKKFFFSLFSHFYKADLVESIVLLRTQQT